VTVRVIQGDCREVLAGLPADSVHCVVTSPPYWGLRDYGIMPTVWGGDDPACEHLWGDDLAKVGGGKQPADKVRWQHDSEARPNGHQEAAAGAFCQHCGAWRGAHGLEPTIDLYVRNAVEIFRAVHRVLRPDGTLWLNLGDSYATTPHGPIGANTSDPKYVGARHRGHGNGGEPSNELAPNRRPQPGLKHKDMVGMPWRVAFALQADGWWLRQDIIWAKPNPMPESVTDRCTKAHEYVFLLTKSARYYFDAEAIKEEASDNTHARNGKIKMPDGWDTGPGGHGSYHRQGREKGKTRKLAEPGIGTKNNRSFDEAMSVMPDSRNKRSVWTVATSPFPEAHFATFPPELIEPCIKAGTSEKGCCAKCGAPWERIVKRERTRDGEPLDGSFHGAETDGTPQKIGASGVGHWRDKSESTTLGWRPTCKCAAAIVPATVLDPFGGAGTTGLVADRLQRNTILIELNPGYAEMARRRIAADAPLFFRVEAAE